MSHFFNVTCYRYDVGIFSVYGARIKQRKVSSPCPHIAQNNKPVPPEPRFIDTLYYEVVLFTNPDLSQSFPCYRNKDLHKVQNYLDNFINLCSRGVRYIDLSKVSDECPCPPPPPHPHPHPCPPPPHPHPHPCPPPPHPHPHPCPPPPHPHYPYGPFYKNDCFEEYIHDDEIDPRYINDPRKNPFYDVFDNISKDPRYAKQPKCVPNPYPPYDEHCIDVDFNKVPKHDGDIITFGPCDDNCPPPPHKPHWKPEPPCPPFEPYKPHPHPHPCPPPPPHPHPCPPSPPCPPYIPPCPPPPPCPPYIPPCPPPHRDKICIYYGNGGFAMGESVIGNNIKEMSRNALRTMLCKNYQSTFSNMNPRDTIVVKKEVLDCILPTEVFKTNMDIAGEWSFFMIPDMYYKLVDDFTWYYKEETIDGQWIEIDPELVQKEFIFQDNGVRYFINAIKLNGRYDMRFAKKGRDFNKEAEEEKHEEDNRELDIDMKFVISIYIEDYKTKGYKVAIQDVTEESFTMVRTLSEFIDNEYAWQAIENHVYKLDILNKDGVTLTTKFFVACPDDNYTHGFCTWIGDNYVEETSIVDQFTKVIDLVPPKTKSAVDRIILTINDIEPIGTEDDDDPDTING